MQIHSVEGKEVFTPVPPSFGGAVHHNSINPVWLPELNSYLGVSHRHYSSGTSKSGKCALRAAHA